MGHARGVRGPGSTVPSSASLVVAWQQNGRTVRSGLSCLIAERGMSSSSPEPYVSSYVLFLSSNRPDIPS